MKKKIVAMCATVAIAAVAVGGTLAYFTDTDSDVNVMTTGNVDIVQLENGKAENGFETQPLMPMVDLREDKTANPVVGGFFDKDMMNVVDKVVTVKNEAAAGAVNQDVYVRTIIAFETATEYAAGTDTVLRDGKEIFEAYIGTLGSFELLDVDTIKIDGVEYVLAAKVYSDALAPQQETTASLKQIFLSPDANNEVAALFGSEYKVLVLSQATQTAGFDTAAQALNTAFGELTAANIQAWLEA